MNDKRLKRFLLIFCAAALIVLAFALVHSLRGVTSVYQRHPEKFEVVAEYFCAQTSGTSHFYGVYAPPGQQLDDEDWPPEVSDAVRYIFRHSRCDSIFAERTRGGVPCCTFTDDNFSDSRGDTGIIYTPREDGQEIFDEVFYPPVSHWNALSDHWFSFILVSYDDYNSGG